MFVAGSSCVRPAPRQLGICHLTWNVSNVTLSQQHEKLQQINSTLASITTVADVKTECVTAIQPILCVSAFPNCSVTMMSSIEQECQAVEENCTDTVAKTYASTQCSSISPYNSYECVEVNVSSGYCLYNETYKIQANNLKKFLDRAREENKIFNATSAQLGISNTCLEEYKRIHCRSFVPSNCSNFSQFTREMCEQHLQCLTSNSTLNKTKLCLEFPNEKPKSTSTIATSTTATPTTAYDMTGVNTTVTVRLGNIKYDKDYANKSTPSYANFSKKMTQALNIAYRNLDEFKRVIILELTCGNEVAVKHNVFTKSTSVHDRKDIEARLQVANSTNGYLKGKITDTNKPCETESGHDHHEDDTNNWVYMIVFVCITALLLLAMVLCNQS